MEVTKRFIANNNNIAIFCNYKSLKNMDSQLEEDIEKPNIRRT